MLVCDLQTGKAEGSYVQVSLEAGAAVARAGRATSGSPGMPHQNNPGTGLHTSR